LRLLTRAQYQASLRALFSFADSLDYSGLEDDVAFNGSRAVGASVVALSPTKTEAYLSIAESAAARAFSSESPASEVVSCSALDIDCARTFIVDFGRKAFRRSLTEDEVERYLSIYEASNQHFPGSVSLEYVTTALLMSPYFLYRIEIGEEQSESDKRILTDVEIASKLAYFLWDAPPDEALLARAESGGLKDAAVLAEEAERLMNSDRFRHGIMGLFRDYLRLFELDLVEKVSGIFPDFTPSLRQAMETETLLNLEQVVLEDGDFRTVFNTGSTHVNAELAAHYGVEGVTGGDFVEVSLPELSLRRGLLGNASLLSLYAHPSTSSPTLRGKFVRETLLCQAIPAPPPDVDTSLPPVTDSTTTRERFAKHSTEPACATCHQMMDPIGLGLENFDAVGAFRSEENGFAIDASGELDGLSFDDPLGLATAIAEHPNVPTCFARTVFRYGWGRLENAADETLMTSLGENFEASEFSVRELILSAVTSPDFYETGKLD